MSKIVNERLAWVLAHRARKERKVLVRRENLLVPDDRFFEPCMEVLKFGSDVWWECIFKVKAHARVVLKVASRATWSWAGLIILPLYLVTGLVIKQDSL